MTRWRLSHATYDLGVTATSLAVMASSCQGGGGVDVEADWAVQCRVGVVRRSQQSARVSGGENARVGRDGAPHPRRRAGHRRAPVGIARRLARARIDAVKLA